MHPENNEVAKSLLKFLKYVSTFNGQSKMTSSNLAIVFGPNILQSGGELIDEVMQMVQIPKVVAYLIENVDDIYN